MNQLLRGARGEKPQSKWAVSLKPFTHAPDAHPSDSDNPLHVTSTLRAIFSPRSAVLILALGLFAIAVLARLADFNTSSWSGAPSLLRESSSEETTQVPAAPEDTQETDIPEIEEGPDLSRPSTCPVSCSQRGTCNEETGECSCLPSFTGPDCSELALPNCDYLGDGTASCSNLNTCECALDCQKLRLPVGGGGCVRGTLPDGKKNSDLKAVFEGPRYPMKWNEDASELQPPDYSLPPDNSSSPLTSPSSCPNNCSGIGRCSNTDSGQYHFCHCPWMAGGPSCNISVGPMRMSTLAPPCFNDCSGRGACHHGTCQCQQGYFGIDCSLFIGRNNKTRILRRNPYAWSDLAPLDSASAASLRPKIYVYELPAYFNTWQGVHSGAMDWEEPVWLLERMLNSPYRTAHPEKADFFYIPLFIRNRDSNKANIIELALEYIRQRWPYHERSGGKDHIVLTNSDWGNCQLGVPYGWKRRHPVLDRVMTVTLWGYTKNMTYGDEAPCFRPGRDIAIPPIMDPSVYKKAPGFPGTEMPEGQKRDILLYFRGSYYTEEVPVPGEYRMSFGARQALWWAFNGTFNETGILLEKMFSGPSHDYVASMQQSVFCFAPAGWGWAMRTTQSVILGCIPLIIQPDVVQPFEGDGLDWSEFSVKMSLEEIPKTVEILKAIPREKLLSMQKALYRVRSKFVWTSTYLSPFKFLSKEEQDAHAKDVVGSDVFIALMEALARRLNK